MKAVNIEWDTDGDTSIEAMLPKEVEIPEGIEEDGIADYLSDITGYCLYGFTLED